MGGEVMARWFEVFGIGETVEAHVPLATGRMWVIGTVVDRKTQGLLVRIRRDDDGSAFVYALTKKAEVRKYAGVAFHTISAKKLQEDIMAKKTQVTTVTITLEIEGNDEHAYAAVEQVLDTGTFQDAIKEFGDDNYGEDSLVVCSAVAS
jgi:predicted dinucleotide-binding enzyme